ncbi:MAG: hypothetical protein GF398_16930 [Chitinivibrionales bacterium]|nr:hypothetical protein [Chitinivibrionales bacterium]
MNCSTSFISTCALVLHVAVANSSAQSALEAPTQLFAFNVGDSLLDVRLQWKDNSGNEEGFTVERRLLGGTWAEIAQVGEDDTMYLDTHLAIETYQYRVRAFTGATYSDYSNSKYAQVVGVPWITITSPVPDTHAEPGKPFYIRWESNQVSEIRIEISPDSGTSWVELNQHGSIDENNPQWQNFDFLIADSLAGTAIYVRVQQYTQPGPSVTGGPIVVSPTGTHYDVTRPPGVTAPSRYQAQTMLLQDRAQVAANRILLANGKIVSQLYNGAPYRRAGVPAIWVVLERVGDKGSE